MGFDKTQIVVGKALVYFNGVHVGFTSEDGVSTEPSTQDTVKVAAAEALGTVQNYRSKIERQIKFSLLQLDLTTLITALGLDPSSTVGTDGANSYLDLKYSVELPTVNLMFIVDGGPNNRTITYETTAQPIEAGPLVFKKTDPTMVEVTMEELMDVTTNTFGRLTTIPAAGSAFALDVTTPFVPADEEAAFVVGDDLEVKFNAAVAHHALNAGNFQLFEVGVGNELTAVPASLSFKLTAGVYDHQTVVIDPTNDLTAATSYMLIVSENVMNVRGEKLAAPGHIDFTTA